MILQRTKEEVTRFNWFKWITLLILLIVLIIMLLNGTAFERTAVSDTPATETTAQTEGTAPQGAAPTIDLPDGDLTAGTVALSGAGTPGSTVELLVDGEVVGATAVRDDGTWAYDLDLPEGGDYELSARTLDANGNIAAEAAPLALALAGLTIPAIDLPDFDFPPGLFSLTGTGQPGDEIELVVDGEVVGTTTVGADGTWFLDLDLPEGEYEVATRVLDANGNVLAESETRTMRVSLPDITLPTVNIPDTGFPAGPFTLTGTGQPGDEVEVVVDGEVLGTTTVRPDGGFPAGPFTLTGTGIPGGEVEIVVNGEVVGTTPVAEDGSWSFDFDLAAGEYDVVTRVLDGDGNPFAEADPITISVVAPAITEPADGATLQSGELMLSGSGVPGTDIEILDNGAVVGTAVVGDDGTWTFALEPEPGNHAYGVRRVGDEEAAATIMTTIESPITDTSAVGICENPQPGIDQGATYVVGECEWLIRIANRLGIVYDALIAVNPQIENPNIIYVGQVINLPPR